MPWYAIQHKPAQGERAVENLQAQEACCFYPKITVERVVRGKRTQRLEPLFPGYLFINLEPGDPLWGKLRSTRGVLRVIGFGGKSAVVDDDIIADIRAGLEAVTWVPLKDRGEVIGAVLRTRAGVKPLYISPGHRISLTTSIEYVMACLTRYRLPETTRWADGVASARGQRWLERLKNLPGAG